MDVLIFVQASISLTSLTRKPRPDSDTWYHLKTAFHNFWHYCFEFWELRINCSSSKYQYKYKSVYVYNPEQKSYNVRATYRWDMLGNIGEDGSTNWAAFVGSVALRDPAGVLLVPP